MLFTCKIGIHKWEGCKCSKCGKIRNEEHDWKNNCEKCSKCGAIENHHELTGDTCKCSKCGKTIAFDIDGNIYHAVTIGTQVWMIENLKVTKFRNGDPIPNVQDAKEWSNQEQGAYCSYENNDNNVKDYGILYNWHAVNSSRHLAPAGWHIPTEDEWATLVEYVGGKQRAGTNLKEEGTGHWNSPNKDATNEQRFSALPGGYRNHSDGEFVNLGNNGIWWCSTKPYNTSNAWSWCVLYNLSDVYKSNLNEKSGFSVRCVQDKSRP